RKIKVVRNREDIGPREYLPVRVVIETVNGQGFETNVTSLKGTYEDPLSWNEVLTERFERCLPYSAVEFSSKRVEAIVAACDQLEAVADARELLTLLNPSS